MNEKTAPAGELTDAQIDMVWRKNLVANAQAVRRLSKTEERFARAIIEADRALRASPAVGDVAAVPTFAQITAIRQAVDAEYEPILAKLQREHDSAMNERNHARHDQEDAQAALAAKDAELAKLKDRLEIKPDALQGLTLKHMGRELDNKIAEIAALTAERDALRQDAAMLDWLDQNIFSRENLQFNGKLHPELNMWVMFSPKGHQGSARNIINAAMTKEPK